MSRTRFYTGLAIALFVSTSACTSEDERCAQRVLGKAAIDGIDAKQIRCSIDDDGQYLLTFKIRIECDKSTSRQIVKNADGLNLQPHAIASLDWCKGYQEYVSPDWWDPKCDPDTIDGDGFGHFSGTMKGIFFSKHESGVLYIAGRKPR